MKRIPKAIYKTADEIEARIDERMNVALSLAPDTAEHRAIMKEISQLKLYAEAKRWLSAPRLKPEARHGHQ